MAVNRKKQIIKKRAPAKMNALLTDISGMIAKTRSAVAVTVNAEMTMLYWNIGTRIRQEVLKNKRAEYGKEIVQTLSAQLVIAYGNSFSEKNLRRMVQFSEDFLNHKIVVSLIRQLSWTHFIALIPLKEPLAREFYAEMCRVERWSVRTLRKKIDSMLFERTALSRKPEKLVEYEIAKLRKTDQLTPDLVFKDPYFLDFLGIKDRYIEKDIEDAILREMEAFLLEFGAGFTFVARQKRISIDSTDYYLDLLFFHRGLRRLVAVELKLDDFKPAHKEQMELYLRWLAKYEMKDGEDSPIGLILCAGKKDETIELLEVEKSGIRVAQYLTELPSKQLLEKRLHGAIKHARMRIENKGSGDAQ